VLARVSRHRAALRSLLNVLDPAVAEDSARHGRVLTAGLGGMGGAQPLAIRTSGGRVLVVEVDPARAERRRDAGWVDTLTTRERGLLVFDAAAI
jgi:urocanate hydratase